MPSTEINEPRGRLSQLSAAILRISASLDVDTVLQEVVDSARALTGARYGIITTVDENGAVQDFVSSGFTDEEHRQFEQWPDGPGLFEHLRDIQGVLKVADLSSYVRALGYSEELTRYQTFQGMPMRHREVHVGNFFLAEKAGGQAFTDEDEEVLVLFASQAATAIANARTHRDEQRARADLEALVETSPVGVIVFDARTGRAASFNREANRIVEGLRIPGRTAEDLLEVAAFQRADGREVRNAMKYVSWKDYKAVAAELKDICQSSTGDEVVPAPERFAERRDHEYPHISRTWRRHWQNLSTLFRYPDDIRKAIYTTNSR